MTTKKWKTVKEAAPEKAPAVLAGRRVINDELFLAGWDHYDGEAVFDQLRVGQPVTLVREPGNKYDPNAIAVYWTPESGEGERRKLGFIPRTSNGALALLVDDGSWDGKIVASISKREISANPWKRLAIKIEVEL